MKRLSVLGAALLFSNLSFLSGVVSAALPKSIVFVPESIGEFTVALRAGRHVALDRQHLDATRYHAYRYLDPDMVLIGVAEAVRVDSEGRVHIVQASRQPMGGHLNPTHKEYSHILLPIDVTPP